MDWIALSIAALSLVAAVTVPVVIYFKQTPRREISYSIERQGLMSKSARSAGISVQRAGVILTDPYIVDLTVESRSRADIPSTSFDDGQPVQFVISVPVIAELATFSRGNPSNGPRLQLLLPRQAGTAGDSYGLLPGLVKKGTVAGIRVLVDGEPSVTVINSLIDIDVRERAEGTTPNPMFLLIPICISLAAVAIFVATNVIAPETGSQGWEGGVATFALAISALGILAAEKLFRRRSR